MATASLSQLSNGLTVHRLEAEGQTVELVPARGGLLTRWTVEGEEVLYLDQATLLDLGQNVRGGVPQLFPSPGKPWAGSPLPQHGFARQRPFTPVPATGAALACELESDAWTLARFPHPFRLRFEAALAGGALRLAWTVANPGPTPLPLHLGIHPYFLLPVARKAAARLEHSAARAFDNVLGREVPVGPVDLAGPEVDLHLLDQARPTAVLHRGGGRALRLSWTPEFTVLVLWTQPGKDFVCVEPWTARGGALATGEGLLQVAPGAEARLGIDLRLE